MTRLTRRAVTTGAFSSLLVGAACGNGIGSRGPQVIDGRVTSALDFLETNYPATRDLRDRAFGVLVMPLVTEAGFGFGGAYGRGALQINGVNVDYYSAAQASVGFQIGAQQFAHALYFMTDEVLAEFRASSGWTAGADIQYTFTNQGENISANTVTVSRPVIGVVFGQAGLLAGVTLRGTKYTRIIP